MKRNLLFLICIGLFYSCSNIKTEPVNNQDEMNEQKQNKEIVVKFFEFISDGKTADAFELVDGNVNWWIPGELPFSGNKTKQEYLQVVSAIKNGFPTGFKLIVTSSISEGNKVASEVESFGVHKNGKNYNNKYHFLFEIKDGKIVSVKEYMDTLHLFQLLQP